MRPPAALLEYLRTSRLLPVQARPSVGTGERRSRRKGAGMEFVDYRPYRAGDDTRHLDPHLYARMGEHVLREYALSQQLPVTIIIDASASMSVDGGHKALQARLLAQLFGFAALAGGDRVQLAISNGPASALSPRWHGLARAEAMFAWIEASPGGKGADFLAFLGQVRKELPAHGLVIVISDWWETEPEPVLEQFFAADQEIVAIQVLEPLEIDPAGMKQGDLIMEDIETGEDLHLTLDAATLERYGALFARRQEHLRALFHRKHWPFVTVSAEDDLSQLFMTTFRAQGILA